MDAAKEKGSSHADAGTAGLSQKLIYNAQIAKVVLSIQSCGQN